MMTTDRARRILVVTDHAEPAPELISLIARRAKAEDVRFRVVVLNPARAEVHLLHPERHDKAREAEAVLLAALPAMTQAAGSPVIGSVSVRHDAMDAVEEILFSEPIDEIILSVPAHHLATVLHQDLQHRLRHHDVPITAVGADTT